MKYDIVQSRAGDYMGLLICDQTCCANVDVKTHALFPIIALLSANTTDRKVKALYRP